VSLVWISLGLSCLVFIQLLQFLGLCVFQIWEYSPAYAIRSYAYLLLHAWPAAFHARILQTNKVRAGQLGSNHN